MNAGCDTRAVAKRFDQAVRAMDARSIDADGRMRLGSQQANAEGAFLASFFSGTLGLVVFVVCAAALAALLVWLFA